MNAIYISGKSKPYSLRLGVAGVLLVALVLAQGLGLGFRPPSAAGAPGPAAPRSCSVPNFTPATNYAVGTDPPSVAVGDFNRDGNPDLATANDGTNNVSVLLGKGAGGF